MHIYIYICICIPSHQNTQNEQFTIEYRKGLIRRQISLKCKELEDIKLEMTNKYNYLASITTEDDYVMIKATLENQYQQHESGKRQNIIKKLNSLSNRNILLPDNNDCFINLSDYNNISECEHSVHIHRVNVNISESFCSQNRISES